MIREAISEQVIEASQDTVINESGLVGKGFGIGNNLSQNFSLGMEVEKHREGDGNPEEPVSEGVHPFDSKLFESKLLLEESDGVLAARVTGEVIGDEPSGLLGAGDSFIREKGHRSFLRIEKAHECQLLVGPIGEPDLGPTEEKLALDRGIEILEAMRKLESIDHPINGLEAPRLIHQFPCPFFRGLKPNEELPAVVQEMQKNFRLSYPRSETQSPSPPRAWKRRVIC